MSDSTTDGTVWCPNCGVPLDTDTLPRRKVEKRTPDGVGSLTWQVVDCHNCPTTIGVTHAVWTRSDVPPGPPQPVPPRRPTTTLTERVHELLGLMGYKPEKIHLGKPEGKGSRSIYAGQTRAAVCCVPVREAFAVKTLESYGTGEGGALEALVKATEWQVKVVVRQAYEEARANEEQALQDLARARQALAKARRLEESLR